MSFQEMMEQIRREKQMQYDKIKRKDDLMAKISQYLSFDPKEKAAYRITKYAKRHFLKPTVNMDPDDIPGVFRMRLLITDKNKNKNFKPKKDKKKDEDAELNRAILESLGIKPEDSPEEPKSKNDPFWVCIDLRVYGPDPYQAIYVNDIEYYFSLDQIHRIHDVWEKIDPNTIQGERHLQDIQYYRLEMKQLIKNGYL